MRHIGLKLLAGLLMVISTPSWAGLVSLDLVEDPSPFGYVPLASFVAPLGCPSNCDDGGFTLSVPSFGYAGQTYTDVILSVNGTLEAGSASGQEASFLNQPMPQSGLSNNVLAPFWSDLKLSAGGGMYFANLDAGSTQYTVYEWSEVPLFGSPDRFTFQIWVENTDMGSDPLNPHSPIWFVYERLDSLVFPVTVGVENSDGTIGSTYYFNGLGTAPRVQTDLRVVATFQDLRVPEPGPVSILGIGLVCIGFLRRRGLQRS